MQTAIAFVMRKDIEGGYSNRPTDSGGPTNMGITQATLARWRGHAVTIDDVKLLPAKEAAAIYAAEYWAKVHCNDLPAGVDLCVFDCAVNQGIGRPIGLLQSALGVKVDGKWGPVTRNAAAVADPHTLMLDFMAWRTWAYMKLDRLDDEYGLGWSRRLFKCYDAGMKL